MLVYDLTDLRGRVVAEFEDRWDVQSYVGRNKIRTSQCTISMDDEAMQEGVVKPLSTRLRTFLDGQIIFNGPVGLLGKDYETGTVTIPAADPWRQLEAAYVDVPVPWSAYHPALAWMELDQGEIIWRLVAHGDASALYKSLGVPSHGIARGTIPLTRPRARAYEPGKQIAEAVTEMTQVIGGPDVELVPVARDDGIAVLLNTHAWQGEDRTADVVFSYQTGTNNCVAFKEEQDGFATRNRFTSQGQSETVGDVEQPPPTFTKEEFWSMFYNGIWEGHEPRPDVSEQVTLQSHAEGELAKFAYPPSYVDLTPRAQGFSEEHGVPPRFGPNPNPSDPHAPDYWIGDIVSAEARQGNVRTDMIGRVEEATITELDKSAAITVSHTIEGLAFALD